MPRPMPFSICCAGRRGTPGPSAMGFRTSIEPHLADLHAVLVLDETGLLKKGRHAAGVARQGLCPKSRFWTDLL
jgi:hypothetical protein